LREAIYPLARIVPTTLFLLALEEDIFSPRMWLWGNGIQEPVRLYYRQPQLDRV